MCEYKLPPFEQWPYLGNRVATTPQMAHAWGGYLASVYGDGATGLVSEHPFSAHGVEEVVWMAVCRRDPRHARPGAEQDEIKGRIAGLRAAIDRALTDKEANELTRELKAWLRAMPEEVTA